MNRVHELVEAAARSKGAELAIIDHDDRSLSWQDVLRASQEAAEALRALGVKPGDRVVLVFENCAEVAAFFFGASLLDATAVPLNARLTPAELERLIAHSDPSAIMFSTSSSDAAKAHADTAGAAPVTGHFGSVALVARPGSSPEPVFAEGTEQVALMLYTSGTTGAPKAAMLTHANMIAGARGSAAARGMCDGDMTYLALPLSHIFGMVTLVSVCHAQGSLRLEARFSVERLYDALNKDVTLLPAVPQMHAHLFHHARAHGMPSYTGNKLRYVSSGGAPLDPAWKREAEAFYGLPLQNGYGLTETAAGVSATRNALGDPDISVGDPMGESILKLDMEAPGAEPDHGIGEILAGGPQVMKGYFRDPEQTAKALTADGFFRTGDLGRFDEAGHLHIVGRSKELIIRSGFNVYPVEVEAILTEHPEVIVAGVVGRKTDGNEEVLAFAKVAPGCTLTEDDLKSFVRDKLAPYKRPERIILAQELPAAPTGKILKAKLIETFSTELDART